MIIDGNLEPFRPVPRGPSGRANAARPDRQAPVEGRPTAEAGAELPVYDTEALRAAATHLLDEGGVEATRDGEVRHNRVEQIRSKLEAGEYDREEIISDVVDRLIDKWHI